MDDRARREEATPPLTTETRQMPILAHVEGQEMLLRWTVLCRRLERLEEEKSDERMLRESERADRTLTAGRG